jgi:hypothetical protein
MQLHERPLGATHRYRVFTASNLQSFVRHPMQEIAAALRNSSRNPKQLWALQGFSPFSGYRLRRSTCPSRSDRRPRISPGRIYKLKSFTATSPPKRVRIFPTSMILILGIERPDQGQMLLEGPDVAGWLPANPRRQCAPYSRRPTSRRVCGQETTRASGAGRCRP